MHGGLSCSGFLTFDQDQVRKTFIYFFLVRTAFNFRKLYLQPSVEYDARLASHGILERERERCLESSIPFIWLDRINENKFNFFGTIILEYVNGY